MATLAAQQIDTDLEATYSACAGGGDQFLAGNDVFIHVKNGHSSPQTVTAVTQKTVEGLAVADVATAVTNAEERFIGPFPPSVYADANGYVQLTYSGVTALTIAVLKL